jgi:uncharacterized protein
MQAFLLFGALLTQNVPSPPRAPIPALIVTGANNHDWEWTSASLERILTATGRFDVTVTTEPAAVFQSPGAFAPFAVFVLDYNGPRFGEPAETNFLDAVAGGKGVVVIHAANNAFSGWLGYEELIALCWREGSGHGAFHPFDVELVDRAHPVTRALPDLVRHPDELYHRLKPMHGASYRLLGRAFSTAESGGTGAFEPMVLARTYGAGRVFHTTLGHVWRGAEETRASHADPQFANLVARGAEWAATGDVADGAAEANRLEPWDVEAGWRLLFDGASAAGWVGSGPDASPGAGWTVEDGALRHARGAAGGDLRTRDAFQDFELELEWKVGGASASGVQYRGAPGDGGGALVGPEYCLQDDFGAGQPADGLRSAAALLDLAAPRDKTLAPTGAWNRARIVAQGGALEHWLNGRRVLTAEVGSPSWADALARSGLSLPPGFAGPRPSPLVLRDRGGEAWFRSLRVRDLAALPGKDVALFDGRSLAGFTTVGDARWSVEDGALRGAAAGGAQSFLVSEAEHADFFLELEVKVEGGNSGIQVRSHLGTAGDVFGYQVELDPGPRAWSGGLYEEGRRGWLQTLEHNPEGRAAFRRGAWNRVRIECVGPSLRAWINGIPTADLVDRSSAAGRIGFQVHSGTETEVAVRSVRLRVLE